MEREEIEKIVRHLEFVYSQIRDARGREYRFDDLYKLLQKEYELEGGKQGVYVMNNYRHSLEQTIDKQVAVYIAQKKKRPIKGAPTEYDDFLSNFSMDVSSQLNWWKYKLNPPTTK
jgi:hypothetical protein